MVNNLNQMPFGDKETKWKKNPDGTDHLMGSFKIRIPLTIHSCRNSSFKVLGTLTPYYNRVERTKANSVRSNILSPKCLITPWFRTPQNGCILLQRPTVCASLCIVCLNCL